MRAPFWLGEFLIDGFESTVARAHRHVVSHAIGDFPDPLGITAPEQRLQFVAKVHEGFSLAQEEIVRSLLEIAAEAKTCKERLKNAKEEHDAESARRLNRQLTSLANQEHVFRKLADSIAWSILVHHWVTRRYYIGAPPVPIDEKNLLAAKRAADWLVGQSPGSFTLLADTTSFVQIGDLLHVDAKRHASIVELKSGDVNEEVRAFLDSLRPDSYEEQLRRYAQEKGSEHFVQLMRVIKQELRHESAARILRDGSGKDPISGRTVWVQESDIELNYFASRVAYLLKQVDVTGSAVDLVDECLHIGVFDARLGLDKVWMTWIRELGCSFPFVDFRGTLRTPLAVPPFTIALRDKDVMDIVMGRKMVLLCLNLDKWIALGRRMGINVQWSTRKETGRALDKWDGDSRPYVHDHKMITVLTGDQSSTVCGGLLVRIFYEFLTPSSALELVSIPLKAPKDDDTSSGEERR